MPRWGDIFGGALSGAGGLMSDLALRQMLQEQREESQQELQEQRFEEARLRDIREGKRAEDELVSASLKALQTGDITPSQFEETQSFFGRDPFTPKQMPLGQLASQAFNRADTSPGSTTEEQIRAELSAGVPGFAEGPAGGVGPEIGLSNEIQRVLGIPAERTEQEIDRIAPEFRQFVTEAQEGPPAPGDFIPGEQRGALFDAGGRQIGPSMQTELTSGQAAAREEEVAQARQRGVNKETYSAEASAARVKEGVAIARAAIGATLEEDRRIAIESAEREAAAISPVFGELVTLSEKINTDEGLFGARVRGALGQLSSYAGYNDDITQFNQLVSRMLRPVALASGAREANISDADIERVDKIIALTPSSTAAERLNSLRFLRNLLLISPVLAATFRLDQPYSSRLNEISGMGGIIKEAEEERIRQIEEIEATGAVIKGTVFFTEPSTGMRLPVIR